MIKRRKRVVVLAKTKNLETIIFKYLTARNYVVVNGWICMDDFNTTLHEVELKVAGLLADAASADIVVYDRRMEYSKQLQVMQLLFGKKLRYWKWEGGQISAD